MKIFWSSVLAVLLFPLLMVFVPMAYANGQASNGYPTWSERVLLEWVNRSRSDPQADLAACPSGNCLEKACYAPVGPLTYDPNLAHSSRFHSAHMNLNNYFDHPSHCSLLSTVPASFLTPPQVCSGLASCSCQGGALTTNTNQWTQPPTRMQMFGNPGNSGYGEIIAEDSAGPNATFYLWLYEQASSSSCGFDSDGSNGHRWIILSYPVGSGYGLGVSGNYSTGDFSDGSTASIIPSGSHYPQQASTVAVWANWNASAGPSVEEVDVDGVCQNLTLPSAVATARTNGAWTANVTGVGTGCHRYFFAFKTSAGKQTFYPTNGSLGIGVTSDTCPDWSSARPADCAGFDQIFADGFE